jgi:D-alanyl-D-alanine carboxypeptidase
MTKKRRKIFLIALLSALAAIGLYLGWHYFIKENYSIPLVFEKIKFSFSQDRDRYEVIDFDAFRDTKEKLIAEKEPFVEINLDARELHYFAEGELKENFPVLAIGREGTWGETPMGVYEIEAKIANKFSGVSKVYMPWAMPIHGNFFIHGEPYFPDGNLVQSEFSGGCIRLATPNAKKLFDLVRVGTPVLVFSGRVLNDQFQYANALTASVTAESFLALDLKSGFVFAGKNQTAALPVYSLANLMVGWVAADYLSSDTDLYIDRKMTVPTPYPRLVSGRREKSYDLLLASILESSDEAGMAFAYYLNGPETMSGFMKGKAESIGMNRTSWLNVRGLSPSNISTAEDLAILAKYVYGNRDFLFEISRGDLSDTIKNPLTFHDLINVNSWSGPASDGFHGGKFSRSKDGREGMIAVFDLSLDGATRPVGIIVLNSGQAKKDAAKILNWIKVNYWPTEE